MWVTKAEQAGMPAGNPPTMNLQLLSTVEEKREELAALLTNCVESGASVGFIPPLPVSQALQYWDGLAPDLQSSCRLLLVVLVDHRVAGAVQLALCTKKNGLHRAEVEKLMVHTGHRRAGLGRALMDGIEQLAKKYDRKLLVLDTRSGDAASALYRKCGYIEAGQIPDYALNATGQLDATTYFYKQL
ncbi:MAG TPA: GNAT family N-acetyltransferase [Polyangiaceae bacterium]|jgi:ribosomal protein S18 acetylase RimI-like enzyme|nr:GNAT family N-acetyltransferase [Polyangiaceae bacterium]